MHARIALLSFLAATMTGCVPMDTTGATSPGSSITGTISAPQSARKLPRQMTARQGYRVVVQSAATMRTYTGDTDENGDFTIDLPENEAGELMMMTVVQPDSRAAGLLLFNIFGNEGFGGVEVNGDVDLGQINFPDDPTSGPVMAGADADLSNATVADDVITRLNDDGVAVGVPSVGRGDAAMGDPTNDPRQQCDRDRDGLINIFDADDDGDGVIDEFDPDANVNPAEADGLVLNFFMNLKISDQTAAGAYFSGDTAAISDSLRTDTVITLEVMDNGTLTKNIAAVRVIGPPAPAPSYLPVTEVLGGAMPQLWSASGYALNKEGPNHFQQFVVPNDFLTPGDSFTVEVTFDDGSVGVYTRMIDYVFHSIPKIVKYGAPDDLQAYAGPETIRFDGSQDLVLEWNPPVDERGMLLTGLDYRFEVFYYDEGGQQIDKINGAATWSTPPAGWNADNTAFEVAGSTLTTPSATDTFSVTLPKRIFVDTVQTASGPVNVSRYKVDIAAENNGNNAALMLNFEKK